MASRLDLLTLLEAFAQVEGYWLVGKVPQLCNNPMDLRFAGQEGSTPSKFGGPIPIAQFDCAGRGIAAGLRQLAKWIQSGLSLNQLIAKEAPPGVDGNNTVAYVKDVVEFMKARGCELDPNVPLWNYLALTPPAKENT